MLFEAKNRLDQLIALRDKLANAIDTCESMRDLAALSRQYRETIREIEEIEGATIHDDEIAEILSEREAAGESRSVR
jgi:hypothetical protein